MNRGQTDAQVKFLARGNGYGVFLIANEVVVRLRQPDTANGADNPQETNSAQASLVRWQLKGANAGPPVTGINPLPGQSNYLLGSDPKHWRLQVPGYEKVAYQHVYPGIDATYYGNQRQPEKSKTLGPHDPMRVDFSRH